MTTSLRPTVGSAVALAIVAALLVGATPAHADPSDRHDTTTTPARAVADERGDGAQTPSPTKDPRYSFGIPADVSVSTSESGMTVHARPDCNKVAFPTCRSYIRVPEVGIDVPQVVTTAGYFIPWPSSWAEGRTITTGTVHSNGRNVFNGWFWGTTGRSLGAVTRPYSPRRLTAALVRQDDDRRTADVSGLATPFAAIRRDGVTIASADQDGSWSAVLGGLPVGTTTIVVEQYIGTVRHDSASVQVTIRAKDLLVGETGETTRLPAGSTTLVTAQARVTSDISTPLSDGRVVFTAPAGTTFAADLTAIRGQYRSPSGGNWVDFGSVNLVDGRVSGDRRTATFRWAPATADWTLPTGSSVRFGIGVENPGTAPSNSVLRTTMSGSAAQGTFDTVATTPVVLVGAPLIPVAVSGPATVAPGATNTVTGTATPGATFEVVDSAGTVIVPGGPFTVSATGTWSFPVAVPAGALEFTFAIRQTATGQTETSDRFTIPADTFREVRLDTASVRDGVANTFSGTATPGATYRVLNVSNTEIVSGGPFTVDDEGHWSFERVVSTGAKEFRFKLEQQQGGATTRSVLFTIPTA